MSKMSEYALDTEALYDGSEGIDWDAIPTLDPNEADAELNAEEVITEQMMQEWHERDIADGWY
jgi:hypothetical protein